MAQNLQPLPWDDSCHDAGLSEVRKAEPVPTTAVANVKENSTLGADAMHAMLPFKTAASLGRSRLDAAPFGRGKGEGGAVAPAAGDATDCARACCALSTTRHAPRAEVFPCLIPLSNRFPA